MFRPIIIAGNWKMYKTSAEARTLAGSILEGRNRLLGSPRGKEIARRTVVLCPPFTALTAVSGILNEGPVALGAQNLHWEKQGAFTGEVSGPMLVELGCRFVIVGHSERRALFGETDEGIRMKVSAALSLPLTPIFCLGESLEQREAGRTEQVVESQLRSALEGLTGDAVARLVIAYEPVWAIGTGRTASPDQANTIHALIRELLSGAFGPSVANAVPIVYGGSVKPENVGGLMAQADIDGALVGGASLSSESFLKILDYPAEPSL